MSTPRYLEMERGVFDTITNEHVDSSEHPQWNNYLEWRLLGNTPGPHTASESSDIMQSTENRDRQQWKIDKTINLPTVIAILGIAATAILYTTSWENRITKIESKVSEHDRQITEIRESWTKELASLSARVDKIFDVVVLKR